jgi:hypothetical protein
VKLSLAIRNRPMLLALQNLLCFNSSASLYSFHRFTHFKPPLF